VSDSNAYSPPFTFGGKLAQPPENDAYNGHNWSASQGYDCLRLDTIGARMGTAVRLCRELVP